MNKSQSHTSVRFRLSRVQEAEPSLRDGTPSLVHLVRTINSKPLLPAPVQPTVKEGATLLGYSLLISKRLPPVCAPEPSTRSRLLSSKQLTEATPSKQPPIPEQEHRTKLPSIRDYELTQLVGQGGHSVVYQAVRKSDQLSVAIKVYEKVGPDMSRRSVVREANLLKHLRHKNIVKFIDKFEDAFYIYVVTEFVYGQTLTAYLQGFPSRRLSEKACVWVFKQIAEAVHYCHQHNISHRDLKLDNVLVTPALEVKLVDFGFSTCCPPHTKSKAFCGTPSYMAPEITALQQFRGPAADVWALGVLLYYLLCGDYPFNGFSKRELFRKIQKGRYTLPVPLSKPAVTLLCKMLQVDPEKRISARNILREQWLLDELGSSDLVTSSSFATLGRGACV